MLYQSVGLDIHCKQCSYLCALAMPFSRGLVQVLIAFLSCISIPYPSLALQRASNTAFHMPLEPRFPGYSLENAFGDLKFNHPVTIASPPGETNRLFIVERPGRIIVITNLTAPTKSVFLDLTDQTASPYIETGMFGLAFHPGFATNGYFYVYRTTYGGTELGLYEFRDRLSRFQVGSDPNRAQPESELVLIDQYDDSWEHNGGDVHFGPDGYLYYSVGDWGPSFEAFPNKQPIDRDFFGGIFRIDVDSRPESLAPNPHRAAVGNYRIPSDNPFIGLTNYQGWRVEPAKIRTEFYALGLRNPFKFAFDPLTGDLYCGDVGAAASEEIDLVRKGGNLGWPYREGFSNSGYSDLPPGFSGEDPIASLSHGKGSNDSVAIIGGVICRQNRFPTLEGAYVFGDHLNGHIWALHYDGTTNPQPYQRLTGEMGISAFGVDPRNHDVLILNHLSGSLKRMVYVRPDEASSFPATLADTGAFKDLVTLEPSTGLVPYSINVPFWSDNATKTRWFCIPNGSFIGFRPDDTWLTPAGTVWVKHFEIEMTNGLPSSRRRLETRFLVKSDAGFYGVTYKWNDEQNDANLVGADGLKEVLPIYQGAMMQPQAWRYPSRAECNACHSGTSGVALGFNTAQLNCSITVDSKTQNQIMALNEAGFFDTPITNITRLRKLSKATETDFPLEHRVRSYFAANCSQCHHSVDFTDMTASWDARITTPLKNTGLFDGRLIVPHDPRNSYLFSRLSYEGLLMPPIATEVINTEATNLVRRWIEGAVPAPWHALDIPAGESTEREGSTILEGGSFVVSGAGEGFDAERDHFHFVSCEASNTVALFGRLIDQQSMGPSAKAGLMVRQENMTSTASYGFIGRGGDGQIFMQSRFKSQHQRIDGGSGNEPVWLQLVQHEETLSGFTSSNGIDWLPVGTVSNTPCGKISAGLAVTSQDNYFWNQARFDQLSIISVGISCQRTLDASPTANQSIQAIVSAVNTDVGLVDFLIDGQLFTTLTSEPFSCPSTNLLAGPHSVVARVTDTNGHVVVSSPVIVQVMSTAPVAQFNGMNSNTQGSWLGTLGNQGYIVVNDETNLPPSANLSVSPVDTVIWESSSTNARALQRVDGSQTAAAWASPSSLLLTLDLLDSRPHLVSLYLVDWARSGMAETIELFDKSGSHVLDTREVSNFEDGIYLKWRVVGSIQFRLTSSVGPLVSGVFLDEDPLQPPEIALTAPAEEATFTLPANILLSANLDESYVTPRRVEFFANDAKVGEALNSPFVCLWTNPVYGRTKLIARVVNDLGITRDSEPVTINILLPSDAAVFGGVDSTTQGNWQDAFGLDGATLPLQFEQLPNYVRLKKSVPSSWVWNYDTEDPRALQPIKASSRMASCWTDYDPLLFDVDLTDGRWHKISFYFLDWDSYARQDLIEVISATDTNRVLDSRDLTDFHNGKYISWFARGHVVFRVSRLLSIISISGIFFDPPPTTTIQSIWSSPVPNGRISILSWNALSGLPYRLEFTTNLNNPVWQRVPGEITADGPIVRTWHQIPGPPKQLFYRVIALP